LDKKIQINLNYIKPVLQLASFVAIFLLQVFDFEKLASNFLAGWHYTWQFCCHMITLLM